MGGLYADTDFIDVTTRMGANIVQVAQSGANYAVNTYLPMIESAGWQACFRISGNNSTFTNGTDFDIDMWTTNVEAWEGTGLQTYIDDGTLFGHMILDDITDWSYLYWGTDPTGDEIEAMAQRSKELWPNWMTFVREKPSAMPVPTKGYYEYLDACLYQYRYKDTEDSGLDVATCAANENAAAQAIGLICAGGLNICDGGDGSSLQPGWRGGPDFWAMSSDEIIEYGTAMFEQIEGMPMFLCWEYDTTEIWPDGTIGSVYFDQANLQDALHYLSVLAAEYDRQMLVVLLGFIYSVFNQQKRQ